MFRKKVVVGIVTGAILAVAATAGAAQEPPVPESRPAAALLEKLLRVPPQASVSSAAYMNG